jgi:5,5'-dehydrodivanillate O-demethylase
MNQDFLAWVGQGRIADRSHENLGLSDKGIVMIRRRFFDEMKRIEAGEEAKGVIRDPARNHAVQLPMMARADVIDGFTKAEIMADPRKRMMFTSFVFQAGQPASVQQAFSEAMGLDATEFTGLARANDAAEAGHG